MFNCCHGWYVNMWERQCWPSFQCDSTKHVQITGEHTIVMIFGKIINYGVLIYADYVVHLNHENKYLRKYNFPIDSCL